MNYKKENLDLVDKNDNVIGKIDRDEAYDKGINNFRTINCFIVNDEGKIWIPRRNKNKRLFPNGLDFSCGGHVEAGDGYLKTFKKEMQEELNTNVDDYSFKSLGKCDPENDSTSSYMEVFELKANTIDDYNKDDFIGYEWLLPSEIVKLNKSGEYMKSDIIKLINKFYI